MQSQMTIVVTIDHDENLPEAQILNQWVAGSLAKDLRLAHANTATHFGRRAVCGPEDGQGVTSFLQSAVFARREAKEV